MRPRRAPSFYTAVGLLGAALSALLLVLATPAATPHPWPMLAWIGFAPWFATLSRLGTPGALLSALVLGLGYTIPGHWEAFGAAVSASTGESVRRELFLALLFGSLAVPLLVFAWIHAALLRRWELRPWLRPMLESALLASLIVGIWAPFPYTPTLLIVDQSAVLQAADIGGEALPLWLLLWSSAWLGQLLGAPGRWRDRCSGALLLAAAAAACLGYGLWRIEVLESQERSGSGVRLQAMPLQLDLPNYASPRTMLSNRAGLSASALELSREGLLAAPQCELAVWPEVPIAVERVGALCQRGPHVAATLDTPVLMQCSRQMGESHQVTAELFTPGKASPLSHAKSSLVPLYERPVLAAGKVEPGIGGSVFDLGAGRHLVPTLCYELHSRDHLRRASLQGGNIVIHMASFTPFQRHAVDEIDLAMSRLRAIEFRMPIVRSANRGAAGWIDAAGRPRALSERLGTSNRCVGVFAPAGGPTLFARFSTLAPWLPASLTLLLALWLRRREQRIGEPTADA